MSVVTVTDDPAGLLADHAIRAVRATQRAVRALELIADLRETAPLASEIAFHALQELHAEMTEDRPVLSVVSNV